jgi:peptide/nickel transport system ATP-binding protein
MIFQEPATALNPVMTIGRQISEVLHAPGGDAASLLRRVRIPDPERAARTYPHLLSGGQRQRAMIAMALAGEPKLLIADEPTTALDVTIQADILLLLADLQREFGLGILLITHNLGVVNRHAHSVSVMYAGRVVEEAPSKNLFATPLHPYTRGLLAATPGGRRGARLREIPGQVPSPSAMPAGCAFAPRCALAIDTCLKNIPPMLELLPGHHAACFRPGEDP